MSPALRTRAGLLTSAFYGAIFMAIGAHLPYWPVWMEDWGLTEGEIGAYMGAAIVVRLIAATVVPAIADRLAQRRAVLALAAAGVAVAALLHPLAGSHLVLFLLTLAFSVLLAPVIPMGEGLGIRAAARHGFAYAHARAVGSVTFLGMAVGLGFAIESFGSGVVIWATALPLALAAMLAILHPGGGAEPGADDRLRWDEARILVRSRIFIVFALAAGLGQGAHATYYAYGTLAWQAEGIPASTIGWLWATGVAAEIVLMLGPGPRWLLAVGPARMLAIAGALGALRWGGMALEPGAALLWPLQCLHAASFGLAHLAAVAFVASAVPGRMAATAQGLAQGLMGGIVFAVATPIAGGLVEAEGFGAAYALAGGMALAACLAALTLTALWRGGRLKGLEG